MLSTQFIASAVVCAAGIANAAYSIGDTFDSSNFFSEFNFFDGADPTEGYVSYASANVANSSGYAGYSNNAVYLGVDHTTVNPTGGRGSVRVTSNKAYTHGLFIADISHMPGGICGVWPAFWTFGPNWPASGEIDIIEGVNSQTTDAITLPLSPTQTATPATQAQAALWEQQTLKAMAPASMPTEEVCTPWSGHPLPLKFTSFLATPSLPTSLPALQTQALGEVPLLLSLAVDVISTRTS
jgi:hypothetical protein